MNFKANDVVEKDLSYICRNLEDEFARMSNKRLLITGGGGFLGFYLVQSVLSWNKKRSDQSIRLVILDNFIRGASDWLIKLGEGEELRLVKHDISKSLPKYIGDFEYIIHAASIASPTFYRKYPIETMDANVNGLRILLEYAVEQQERNRAMDGFLFLSSSEIYGDPPPENIPTPEHYNGNVSCTGPRACYDESKRFGETLCVNFACQYGLPIKTVRPFNNYGPGLKITDRRVIPDFARDVLAERDIVMFSNGSPTRTFCYVADAIVGYFKVLVKGRKGEAYNIGVEEPEISIGDLADRIVILAKELFGYQGKVVCRISSDSEYLTDNPNRRCPSIAKARTEVGYNPSISIDEGLRRLLIWYQVNQDVEKVQ